MILLPKKEENLKIKKSTFDVEGERKKERRKKKISFYVWNFFDSSLDSSPSFVIGGLANIFGIGE